MDQSVEQRVNVREALYRVLDSIKQLPSPPEVCLAVTQATGDEGTSLTDLQELVANDIALSGRLMQVANSAFFGVRQPVTSVRRAISLLGFGTVRSLALGFFFNEEFGKLRLPGLPYPDLPRYALASSVLAEATAKRFEPDLAADAGCLGLLHESGVLVMALAFGTQYRRMVAALADGPDALEQAERAAFGVDHVQAGKLLLENWKLSEAFIEAAAHHHAPALPHNIPPGAAGLWRILRLAVVAALLFFDDDPAGTAAQTRDLAGTLVGADPQAFTDVIRTAVAMYEQRMAVIGVPTDVVVADTQRALAAADCLAAPGTAA
ncbi:MAG: HDOD domain-containing protein [Planctomycetes bacterium]|nr:HDOD domain-containing protein [Planctomycetota bacterium]